MVKENFWQSERSQDYSSFACNVPSDIPAYEVCYRLLRPKGKRIVDFGCFEGRSSARLLEEGAKSVVGVDKNEKYIKSALKNYGVPICGKKGPLDFKLSTGRTLNHCGPFDGAMMSFVHQTIDNLEELEDAFKTIHRLLNFNTDLIILGTSPNAPSGRYNFNFSKVRFQDRRMYYDPEPFDNQLKLANGESLDIVDYNWSNRLLRSVLWHSGFRSFVHPLKRGIDRGLDSVLDRSIKEVEIKSSGIKWQDEWAAPLYQVIHATKR